MSSLRKPKKRKAGRFGRFSRDSRSESRRFALFRDFFLKLLDYLISAYRIIWIFSVCCAMAVLVIPFLICGMSADWGHRYLRPVWSFLVVYGSFIRAKASGLENIDPHTPCVFVVNHASEWDIFVFTHFVSVQWRAVIKADLRTFPVVGPMAARLDQIFLSREGGMENMLTQCAPHITRGQSILFFPEGRRTEGAMLNDFRSGAFVLAQRLQIPVLPVVITEQRPAGRAGAFGRKFGHLPGIVQLRAGEPIQPPRGVVGRSRQLPTSEKALVDALKNRVHGEMLTMIKSYHD